jgi:hypothetical protein
MAKPAPTPRPALTKSPDAQVHPVSGRSTEDLHLVRSTSFKPSKGGATTADAVITSAGSAKHGKLVDVTVRMPKSIRKKLRAIAKERGQTMDDVVNGILAGSLPR